MKKWILVGAIGVALLMPASAFAQSSSDTKTVTAVPLPAPASELKPGGMAGYPKKALGDRVADAVGHLFRTDDRTEVAQVGNH